jgi:hypothetical protein
MYKRYEAQRLKKVARREMWQKSSPSDMMQTVRQPYRDRTAIGLSIVAHVCLFALLAVTVHSTFLGASEEVEQAQYFTITHSAHHPKPVAQRLVKALPPRVAVASARRVRLAAPMHNRVARNPQPDSREQYSSFERAAPDTGVAHAAAAANAESAGAEHGSVADAAAQGVAAATTPVPTATPTATPQPQAPPGEDGLFGSNYQPVPQPPNALAAIIARITGRFHIRVKVDENGRAMDVRFLTPIADATLANDVRARLLAMSYVPALCSGLKCAGDLDIHAP